MEGDADLVARVRSGDRDSFDELYDTYADDVFSMCLLILGDPTVARAAAGTAFALVARTRLNPLTDPNRLRPWLLELARGSALAWSGSPQARSVPVPHGVSPEEMIDGAVVPAPASLRAGLARTFDRAAIAAADRQPTHLGLRKVSSPETDTHDAPTEVAGAARLARQPEPTLAPVGDSQPRDRQPYDDGDPATVVPFRRPAPGRPPAASAEWRTRPAITVAAALVLAVAGVTVAVSWPTSTRSIVSDTFPEIAVVSPSAAATQPTAPRPPKAEQAPAPAPTVAGMFTSVPADERPGATSPPTTATDAAAPTQPSTTTPPVSETPGDPTTEPVPTETSEVPTDPVPTDGGAPPTEPSDPPPTQPSDPPPTEPSDPPTVEPTENPTQDPPGGPTDPAEPPPILGPLTLSV